MPTDVLNPDTANATAASRILHERLGHDARLGPPEELAYPASDASPALRLLRRWFSADSRAAEEGRGASG